MGVLAIRRLVDQYTISELQRAEFAIIQEKPVTIEVDGKDQAERLTNVIAAEWILEDMKRRHCDFGDALCEYSKKVRAPIEI